MVFFRALRLARDACDDGERLRLGRAGLCNRNLNWLAIDDEHALVGVSVPSIDGVVRTPSECPHRQIEAKRGNRC